MVEVELTDVQIPILEIQDAIHQQSFDDSFNIQSQVAGDVKAAFDKADHIIEGQYTTHPQYQFFLENHVSSCSFCLAKFIFSSYILSYVFFLCYIINIIIHYYQLQNCHEIHFILYDHIMFVCE